MSVSSVTCKETHPSLNFAHRQHCFPRQSAKGCRSVERECQPVRLDCYPNADQQAAPAGEESNLRQRPQALHARTQRQLGTPRQNRKTRPQGFRRKAWSLGTNRQARPARTAGKGWSTRLPRPRWSSWTAGSSRRAWTTGGAWARPLCSVFGVCYRVADRERDSDGHVDVQRQRKPTAQRDVEQSKLVTSGWTSSVEVQG